MKPKVIKIIITLVILTALIGTGIGLYIYYNNQGPIVGSVQCGAYYHLTSIRPTERFAGATMSHDSYFRIKAGGKTGELYLKDLTATNAPIPFIVTNYKESHRQTVIDFEYIIKDGENTKIQHLTAISTRNEIRIKTVESHQANVIQQNSNEINSLEYEVTILVFSLDEEAASWCVVEQKSQLLSE